VKKDTKAAAPRGEAPEAAALDSLVWTRLTALGALSALWSLFLWAELVVSRSGGGSFCGFGGRFDCTGVWSGALASAVHRLTGLPVAGWGLAWSAAAFALALSGLSRLGSGGQPGDALISAVRWTALAGVAVVAGLAAASLAAGTICIGCIGTYVFVGAYGAIAWSAWRRSAPSRAGRGAALALSCVGAAFVLLLYPGLHTPKVSGEAGRQAVVEAAAATSGAPAETASPAAARAGTGDPGRDRSLEDLVANLDPMGKQTLADSLAIYRNSPPAMLPAPRALVGSTMAPLRITEFTDILCEHCAGLYATLQTLREHAPPGSFSVDARQFPLDGRCNAKLEPGKGDDVRCVAAAARICAEATGREPELTGALFASQKGLTGAKVFELAAPYLPRERLAACIAAPSTRAALEQDIAAASQYDSDGTPIVAVNGRRGTSFGPFLYAMILTRGNADHPAFDALPPGDRSAHLH
jgi:serine/threonine-protein kinase